MGVTKRNSIIDVVRLENALREELNKTSPRVFAVVDPIKVVITNYPEDKTEMIEAVNNPENPDSGIRKIPFSKELFIERDDFSKILQKFFRLSIGKEVGLKYAYFINALTCKIPKGTGKKYIAPTIQNLLEKNHQMAGKSKVLALGKCS